MNPQNNNRFLVSFCNNKMNDGAHGLIGRLDLDADRNLSHTPIKLKIPEHLPPKGVTGLCWHQEQLVVMLQSTTPTLLFFDQQFELQDQWALTGLKGIHTILSHQGSIYLSVTGQDKIVRTSNGQNFEVVWQTNQDRDTIHLNSLCIHQDRLFFTAFGNKADQSLWSSAKQGVVHDTVANQPLINDIWHPHSLFSHQDQLYFCHSSLQSIESIEGAVAEDLPGYSRGLFLDSDLIICGTSKGRLISHTTGEKISNISDRGILAGVCGVWAQNRASGASQFLNLDHVATEVFDIIPWR